MLAKFSIVAALVESVKGAVAEDLMPMVRGLGLFNTYKAYSGFLDGRQDEKGKVVVHLHYVFLES
jgi:hypothetical protein